MGQQEVTSKTESSNQNIKGFVNLDRRTSMSKTSGIEGKTSMFSMSTEDHLCVHGMRYIISTVFLRAEFKSGHCFFPARQIFEISGVKFFYETSQIVWWKGVKFFSKGKKCMISLCDNLIGWILFPYSSNILSLRDGTAASEKFNRALTVGNVFSICYKKTPSKLEEDRHSYVPVSHSRNYWAHVQCCKENNPSLLETRGSFPVWPGGYYCYYRWFEKSARHLPTPCL